MVNHVFMFISDVETIFYLIVKKVCKKKECSPTCQSIERNLRNVFALLVKQLHHKP